MESLIFNKIFRNWYVHADFGCLSFIFAWPRKFFWFFACSELILYLRMLVAAFHVPVLPNYTRTKPKPHGAGAAPPHCSAQPPHVFPPITLSPQHNNTVTPVQQSCNLSGAVQWLQQNHIVVPAKKHRGPSTTVLGSATALLWLQYCPTVNPAQTYFV